MTDQATLMTRKEYMGGISGDREENSRLHRKYYAQFVNQATIDGVLRVVSGDKILHSVDPHFNDIDMRLWDAAGATVRFAIKFSDVGDYPTKAGLVCVVKEAARQYVEQHQAAGES